MVRLEIGPGSEKIGGAGAVYAFNPKADISKDVFIDIDVPPGPYRPQNFLLADAHCLPFKSEIFTDMYASHVLEHLRSPHRAIREAIRVLAPEGRLHIWVPNWLDRSATLDKTHRWRFSFFSLRRLLRSHGLKTTAKTWSFASALSPPTKKLLQTLCLLLGAELHVVATKEKNERRDQQTKGDKY